MRTMAETSRNSKNSPSGTKKRIKIDMSTWNVAKPAVQNREGWADNVTALSVFWRGEIQVTHYNSNLFCEDRLSI